MALSSKADREILAQNVLTNEERRAAKERQLFGNGSSGIGGASRYPLLSNHPQLNAKPSMEKRRSSPKVKGPIRLIEEDLYEEHELEWEEMPERNWEEPNPNRSNSAYRTMLEWASFDWKPDPKRFLMGISNYTIYRETILLQLECIAVIQRTVTEEVAEMIVEARNYQAAGGQSSSTHLIIPFKQAVKDEAGKWHNMVSSLSRFHEWKLEQLLQDFISSHFERVGRGDGLTRNSSADIKGVLSNTHIEKGKFPKKKQHGNGDVNKNRRKIVRCWKCKGEGHFANKCPEKNKEYSINNTNSSHVVPPAVLTNEYCVVSEDEASSINYSAKFLSQHFENLVEFYDKEIARHSANSANQETSEIVSPNGSINIAQQILSTSSMSSTTDRLLFDTGANIDATYKRTNLVPDTIVDLGLKQFPVQTGSGVVYAECVDEVLLPLKGVKSERMVIRLKYVVCLKSLPLNIMSGERFYRRGGYLDRNRIISCILTHIDTERRGFFLWLHGRPEPLKSVSSKTLATHTSSTLEVVKESKSTANKVGDQEFRVAYNTCHTNGIFKISDDVMKRLIL
ncbi:hypothetical protein EPUL_005525 [Erysiphe pulchra]|uniref:CCHC-type domain-containing protein n=1 Tax=Erysiphe pulchra TaxID=225359 RepID=A0A2S4PLG7_9PEZI|nr:hypothetical protein EPUL_005525 [Erysiphe pulchra]